MSLGVALLRTFESCASATLIGRWPLRPVGPGVFLRCQAAPSLLDANGPRGFAKLSKSFRGPGILTFPMVLYMLCSVALKHRPIVVNGTKDPGKAVLRRHSPIIRV